MGTLVNTEAQYPRFPSAVSQLRALLATKFWPAEIVWLDHTAIAVRDKELLVNPRRALTDAKVARAYDQAITEQFGVLLAGLAHDHTFSYCYLWAPATARQREERMMPNGLKLSVPLRPRQIRRLEGIGFSWWRIFGPAPASLNEVLT